MNDNNVKIKNIIYLFYNKNSRIYTVNSGLSVNWVARGPRMTESADNTQESQE